MSIEGQLVQFVPSKEDKLHAKMKDAESLSAKVLSVQDDGSVDLKVYTNSGNDTRYGCVLSGDVYVVPGTKKSKGKSKK